MNARPRRWLIDGRPRLGLVFLAGAVLSVFMLFYEGARPPHSTQAPFPHFDKLLHFGAHGWISALAFTGAVLLGYPRTPRKRAWLACAGVLVADGLLGIGIEIVQYTLGSEYGRVFDWKDVVSNLAGSFTAAVGGVLVVLWLLRAYTETPAPEGK